MGTRNLTMVISQGETKIAQYGQWDGYPDGQGKTALQFLLSVDLVKFKERLSSLNWLSEDDAKMIDNLPDGIWQKEHPYLSRDRGADILNLVMYGSYSSGKDKVIFGGQILGLVDSSNFAGDSLSNEWTYVIDLDKMTFEVYKGFNKNPVKDGERFSHIKDEYKASSATYYAVSHLKTYSLTDLPTVEKFISDLEPIQDEK